MRIWLDPAKTGVLLANAFRRAKCYSEAQNGKVIYRENPGHCITNTQQLTATVRAQSRLQTVDQFKNIIVKSQSTAHRIKRCGSR